MYGSSVFRVLSNALRLLNTRLATRNVKPIKSFHYKDLCHVYQA